MPTVNTRGPFGFSVLTPAAPFLEVLCGVLRRLGLALGAGTWAQLDLTLAASRTENTEPLIPRGAAGAP